MGWLTLLSLLLPLLEWLLKLFAGTKNVSELPAPTRQRLCRVLKQVDTIGTEAARIGLPLSSPEVQNAQSFAADVEA
jgi:hypothetical protein